MARSVPIDDCAPYSVGTEIAFRVALAVPLLPMTGFGSEDDGVPLTTSLKFQILSSRNRNRRVAVPVPSTCVLFRFPVRSVPLLLRLQNVPPGTPIATWPFRFLQRCVPGPSGGNPPDGWPATPHRRLYLDGQRCRGVRSDRGANRPRSLVRLRTGD